MIGSTHFIAVLLHPERPARDTAVLLPLSQTSPPEKLEIITEFGGAAALDVYDLEAGEEWPRQAVFTYRSTIPATTTDVGGNLSTW